ncbi:MAG: CocE/NonD family hydrolase [Litorivicinaceae bacterium]
MRDGIRLATDIYFPEPTAANNTGSFPVLMERTPYDKSGISPREVSIWDPHPMSRPELAKRLTSSGFVVIFQDCRGRYASEGQFTKYLDEGEDGLDTLIWLREQSWFNGQLGMFGLSYGAHTQLALACYGPPELKALVLDCGGFANAYRGGIRRGGAFELKQATWAFKNAQLSQAVQDNPAAKEALSKQDIRAWFADMPWARGRSPLQWAPEYETYLFDQWERGVFDDSWRQIGLYAEGYYAQLNEMKLLCVCGWYDPYIQSTIQNFLGSQTHGGKDSRLILGPWTHGARSYPFAGDIDFGSGATLESLTAVDYTDLRLQWFKAHLLGQPSEPIPVVQYFRMGGGTGKRTQEGRRDHGGRWLTADRWPPARMTPTSWFLHPEGRLSQEAPDRAHAYRQFTFDPTAPVPTIGGSLTSGLPVFEAGAFHQIEDPKFFGSTVPGRPLCSRPDVLSFVSDPLEQAMEVTGSIQATLYIASTAVDTDFTVKVIDEMPPNEDYPDGYAMNLTDGILRCRYRDSFESPSLMTPGQLYKIEIDIFPTSNLFLAGSRIRVDISSSNFPHFDVNPNTGDPEGPWTRWQIATNRVWCCPDYPSVITLPLAHVRDPNA